MYDTDSGIGLVDMLTAGTGGTVSLDLQIGIRDLDIFVFDIREDDDRRGRGVDSALCFRCAPDSNLK